MRESSKQSEAIHSRVGRGKSRRGVHEVIALLESVHDHHHAWNNKEIAIFAAAMDELHSLEARLATTPRSS